MSKLKFSANLGFLWTELPLPDAILAAKANGFDAVECHWPYDTNFDQVLRALKETSLSMCSINTLAGDRLAGEFGLCTLPNRESEAQRTIDQALHYASLIHCPFVHVMAGKGQGQEAHRTFMDNLTHAASKAKALDVTLLIEPLNQVDAPGYFLNSVHQAATIISELGVNNIKLLFDYYHLESIHGNVTNLFNQYQAIIGHIQIASVPGRNSPDCGALDYRAIFKTLASSSYTGFIGAEYKPSNTTEASLTWMQELRLI